MRLSGGVRWVGAGFAQRAFRAGCACGAEIAPDAPPGCAGTAAQAAPGWHGAAASAIPIHGAGCGRRRPGTRARRASDHTDHARVLRAVRRQRVQTLRRLDVPFSTRRTCWRFGSKRRRFLMLEWLTA